MQNFNFYTLVFDWGNTIMVDNPQYSGKMKDWPVVEAMENAAETLQKLFPDFNLVLATNAEDSTVDDIKLALGRVNLESFFSTIFTIRELQAKKPHPDFFHQVSSKLDLPCHQLVMIGDDYQNDILAAKSAGWNAIWFNPTKKIASAHLPIQDMEIRDLSQLPDMLRKPFLPDIQTCISWYLESGATHTLLAHVNNVAAISYQIAIWLEEKGCLVDPILAHRGGLLHDLAKLRDESHKNHAELAADILRDKNQIELAEIARRHLIGNLLSENEKPKTWEQKIVNYADKLSEGSAIVSLDQRLDALQKRYPDFSEKIKRNTPLIKNLENEILVKIGNTPEEFLIKLKSSLFDGHS
ncbi:MAG TPA: HAD-IA family hydrolase [Anaerolineaceae bacterium]|nr:HAD-IA family hydrolase [Anaerolineaceae bacterium]